MVKQIIITYCNRQRNTYEGPTMDNTETRATLGHKAQNEEKKNQNKQKTIQRHG